MSRALRELESSVEDDVVAWAMNRQWLCRKMQYVGRRRCPDHWFFKYGKLYIIEFKRPGIDEADVAQRREHKKYAAAGWKIHVINDRDTACMLLEGEPYTRD